MLWAAIVIQNSVRVLYAKERREELIEQKLAIAEARETTSAISLQAGFRMIFQKRRYHVIQHCLLRIQALVRGVQCRERLALYTFAAEEIQRVWRGHSDRCNASIRLWAVLVIQAHTRALIARLYLEKMSNAVFKIQSAARVILAKSKAKEQRLIAICSNSEYRRKEAAALIIQEHVRRLFVYRRLERSIQTLQCFFRVCISKKRTQRQRQSIIFIQSYVRGHNVRRNSSKKVRIIARRVKLANKNARLYPEMRLSFRTTYALQLILKSKRLSEIMNAVQILEVSTRLSTQSCVAFASTGATSILYDFIPTCNRSLPHIELLHLILKVLTNVARHEDSFFSVSTNNSVDVLLTLMCHFRDKGQLLFLASCLLYDIIERDTERRVRFIPNVYFGYDMFS